MSGAAGGSTVAGGAVRNRAARVSVSCALAGVGFLLNFGTPLAWLNPPIFLGLAALCGLAAVPIGHVGRFRGRRRDKPERGLALLGIVTGWLVLLTCLLATAAFLGLVTGLAVIADRT
ncbi:DUF4190 domain-containing protein [Streptomyces sp. NPDC001595]|uniref:DUF4190 domain-containing protein n=1 Tax=Streptomyces sp. NPDC001532 TaxID=3154520 RepID=UPI00331DB8C6